MRFVQTMFIIFFLLGLGCSKEKSNRWYVEDSGIVPDGDCLILVNNDDYSETRQYELGHGCGNIVWEEDHLLPPSFFQNNEINKQIIIEIPENTGVTYFHFSNEEIYDKLKSSIWHRQYSKHDGYYRIHKGVISGEKVNGEWQIFFDVTYGGKNNDKYRMVKDAAY
jgi:hypothetical protein